MASWLRRASLHAQIGFILGSVAVVAASLPPAFVLVTVAGAAIYLGAYLHRTIDEMRRATEEIARGGFSHRISTRRADVLGNLAASIDTMADHLQELERARRKMLASVSHELRTPLTIIRGHTFTLGRHEQDERRRGQFELVDREIERLTGMIDDLLAAAALQASPVVIEARPTSADALLRSAVERFRERAAERHVEVVARADDAVVRADRLRLDQVLGNLLANAIAHAPADSTVELRATCDSDEVVFSVRNGGEPIPSSLLPEIFEPFIQGTRRTGSVGLGLSIARDIVAAHGAQLQVRSDEAGTLFWFSLTMEDARASRPILVPRYA